MRWNRVWETDRAMRLDRMGSPAKVDERGAAFCVFLRNVPTTVDRLREVGQVNYAFFSRDPVVLTLDSFAWIFGKNSLVKYEICGLIYQILHCNLYLPMLFDRADRSRSLVDL